MKIRILIVVAAVALLAVPSFAQNDPRMVEISPDDGGGAGWSDSSSYQSGEYLDNPCTATVDWVWVSYSASVYYEGWQTSQGDEPVFFDESTTLGGGYAASGSSQAEVAAQQPYSLRQYHKVNTPDDFHVVTVITYDPGSRQTTISRETACGNGQPDSAQ